jgi:hypothetical protein
MRKASLYLVLLLVAAAAILLGVRTRKVEEHVLEPHRWAIIYTPGPAWVVGKPMWEQNLTEHAKYHRKLMSEKKLILGGPFDDGNGGLAIIETWNVAEAKSMVNSDPAVLSRLLVPHLHSWTIEFDKFKPESGRKP